jgi:hypothetical protein
MSETTWTALTEWLPLIVLFAFGGLLAWIVSHR